MKKIIYLPMLLSLTAMGQTFNTVDTNVVSVGLSASGSHFWEPPQFYGFRVPKNTGLLTIFAGEWWIGGYDAQGNLRLSADTYRQGGDHFRAGPSNDFDSTTVSSNKVWRVTRSEIQDHQANYTDPSYNTPADLLTWPGNGDVSIGEAAVLAPFEDLNGNGLYEPLQGEYPCIRGDMALYAIYTDDMAVPNPLGPAVGVEVHTMIYEYHDFPGYPQLDSVVLNHTKFIYRGADTLYDVYVAHFVDFDVGNYADDYVGCDVPRNLFYGYNGDEDDDGTSGYGLNPPAQGVRVLAAPPAPLNDLVDNDHDGLVDEQGEQLGLHGFLYYENDFSVRGNPETAHHHYQYMTGYWKDGTSMVRNGTNGHAPIGGPGTPTTFLFPGDTDPSFPGDNWTEITAGNTPSDRRGIGSFGPIDLTPGTVLEFDLAYVYSRTLSGGRWASVEGIGIASDSVAAWFGQQDLTCDYPVALSEVPVEVGIFPNPAPDFFHVGLSEPAAGVQWALYSLIGQQVASGMADGSSFRVDVRELPAGAYVILLSGSGLQISRPVIVQ